MQNARVIRRASARTHSAELDRLLRCNPLVHRSHAGRFADRAHVMIESRRAEEFELFSVELNAFCTKNLLQDQSARIIPDNESIRFRLIHEIRLNDPAGARHVLDYNRWIAGDMFPEMPRS